MAQIPPIDDAYINEIIKSNGPYNPALLKTQGVKMRELIKLLRDRMEQGDTGVVHTTGDESISGTKTFTLIKAEGLSVNNLANPSLNTVISPLTGVQTKLLNITEGAFGVQLSASVLAASRSQLLQDKDGVIALTSDLSGFATLSQFNTELALKINNTARGVPGGVSTLDSGGKIPASQLDLSGYALNDDVIHTTGNETKSGKLILTGGYNFEYPAAVPDYVISTTDATGYIKTDADGVPTIGSEYTDGINIFNAGIKVSVTGIAVFKQLNSDPPIVGNFATDYLTSNQNYYLPDASGTLALTSDLAVTSLTTIGTNGSATLIDGVLNIPKYSGGGGVTAMAAIGAAPNANGATISGSTLTLQPASASFGGIITTGIQTIGGDKTFTGLTEIRDNAITLVQTTGNLANVLLWPQGIAMSDPVNSSNVSISAPTGTISTTGHILANWGKIANAPAGPTDIVRKMDIDGLGGVTTMTAIGASANANGATISGSTLTLQPASASFGGVVTTGIQTISGAKTFSSDLSVNGLIVGRGAYNNDSNTAIGANGTLSKTTGFGNTGLGSSVLVANTAGNNNTAIGYTALPSNISGGENTVVGANSLVTNTTGNHNTAIGSSVLRFSTGSNNTAIGHGALNASPSWSGGQNTAVGNGALSHNRGSNNTAIGHYAGVDSNTPDLTNTTSIGYGAIVNTDNTIQLGDANIKLINSSGAYQGSQFRLSELNIAPSSATDTGITGEIRITVDYIYVCTATDTWVRSALTSW